MNKLKVSRFLKGMTQDELFIKTGIHQSRISRIENDFIKPTSKEKELIAKALRATPEELFREG